MVEAGEFRADLYHRLAVIPIEMPPLRERPGDVALLVDHFCDHLGLDLVLSEAALEALATHSWPGNVRELRNVLERTAVLVRDRPAEPADLRLGPEASPVGEGIRPGVTLEELDGNKSATARELGIGLSTLKAKLKKYSAGS
jgi:DNA-binding NtrC family response regulator